MSYSMFVTLKEKKDVSGEWKFTCQHGEEECVGNLIEVRTLSL